MPIQSQLSLLRRAALPRRVPFWAQALALCALFAIACVAALDDYGVGLDEPTHREMAIANVEYIATGATDLLYYRDYRYYGVAFDISLLMLERAFGLQDTRDIYLTRHLIMHLFFIAGGFACGMLAYRTLGSRWIALLAMLMFLLHPRLYAHSFFNVKDIPFAAMLLIVLYLTHRAFRRETLGAFLLCGVVVGLAINMRPFGLMLLPMILAMRALDLWQAGRGERKRILVSIGIFAAAALAITYIIHPYYWDNPLRFIDSFRFFSQHTTNPENLFMGEIYRSDAVPWNYIPVWFAITAPPAALTLGAIGCAAVCWQGITRPLAALRDRETRFGVLLLGCFVLPVVAVIVLQSTIYNGWRQMYFLWGPFCLLTAVGMRALVGSGAAKEAVEGVAARLPGWVRGDRVRRALTYGAAGVGLLTTLTAMATLHPHQQVYFNAMTDTKTPGALGKRYDMDYWHVAQRQAMEYLLARYPDDILRVWPGKESNLILPQNDRERIVVADAPGADFYFHPRVNLLETPHQPPIHAIQAYGNVITPIIARDTDAYRAQYNDAAANGTLLARSDFDVYAHNGALYYLKAPPCEPTDADVWFFVHIIPDDPANLPADRREHGFENLDFKFADHGARIGDECVTARKLPRYPTERIRTGQYIKDDGMLWGADINLAARAAAQAVYDGILAGGYGKPVAQSHFDLYLRDNTLAYLKNPCASEDTDASFFLHIFPADPADLPANSRESGFANLDFQFADHGADIGGKCVASLDLPDYPLDRIRTGQFISGEGRVWSAEFPVPR